MKASAEANSPEMRAAEASVQQVSSDIEVARGGVLPSVSFDYFYGINANQFATHDPAGNQLLGSVAQVQLNVPVWSWGAAQSKVKQARIARAGGQERPHAGAAAAAGEHLNSFYLEAEIARGQMASLRQSLDLADESLKLTLLRYQAGEVTVLEVVDAQTTLVDARNAYDDGLVRYRLALAALQTLTGAF